ncbi:MAG: DNA gyrase subunit A [Candidatus Actinomarina sp.]|nr:DNA gyrase subunit A [Actinomycetota bacterium]
MVAKKPTSKKNVQKKTAVKKPTQKKVPPKQIVEQSENLIVDENLSTIKVEDEISKSFLDYAMSVIVARALPDVKDGLKPVQRRILYSMYETGIRPTGPFRKCSKVVGDVMGNYHPHGNDAIYGTLVRLGQHFSTRYPLIEPQGNFGTPDDPPAAMRYTESRMSLLASQLLDGIDEETVDFDSNYSGETFEPKVLPARFPNLLVNGAEGIAVAMATNMPPYNLREITEAVKETINNKNMKPKDYLKIIKGPDFPTGGLVVDTPTIKEAILTGRGSIKMRAVADVEELGKGRSAIVVKELPYQASTDRIMEKIASLVQDKKLLGVSDLRNESSDRNGTRLVVELKRDAVPQVVLNELFKQTQLQDTFSVNSVALVDGVPKVLSVPELVQFYIDHQIDVIQRRTKHRLEKAENRLHIVEGLLLALNKIDQIIKVIKASKDVETARKSLMSKFKLSEIQASHILDMPLRRLTALEMEKLEEEKNELKDTIKNLKEILKSRVKQDNILIEELEAITKKFGDERRSRIVPDVGEVTIEDLIEDEEIIVSVSANGYVKSVPSASYKKQGRGGKGVKAASSEEDIIEHLIATSVHSYLLFFTDTGKVYRAKAHEIPKTNRTARGSLIQNVLTMSQEEKVQAIIDTRDYETEKFLLIMTEKGVVKKSKFKDFDSNYKSLQAITLKEDDKVVSVKTTSGNEDVILVSQNGQAIRFEEKNLKPQGRTAQGVRGIKLREGDKVVGASTSRDETLLFVTAKGYGKRTKLDEFRKAGRGGMGVKALKVTESKGNLVGARSVDEDTEVMLMSTGGTAIRCAVKQIKLMSRSAQGVRIMKLSSEEEVSAFIPIKSE